MMVILKPHLVNLGEGVCTPKILKLVYFNVTVWRPSICPFKSVPSYNAASVHFGPTVRKTDVLVQKIKRCRLLDHCVHRNVNTDTS